MHRVIAVCMMVDMMSQHVVHGGSFTYLLFDIRENGVERIRGRGGGFHRSQTPALRVILLGLSV